jgi:alkyl hydroperoxide reductase subunit D
MFTELLETKTAFAQDLLLEHLDNQTLDALVAGESKYLKDARMNLSTFQRSKEVTKKELAFIALGIAANNSNRTLELAFSKRAAAEGAKPAEIADVLACASIMSANNVLYRFRHFMDKESYNKMPAGMRMQVMMNPSVGKEFFELLSLAISAVNGCEMCVRAHEDSLLKLGTSEARIFESVKIAAVISSLCKIIY